MRALIYLVTTFGIALVLALSPGVAFAKRATWGTVGYWTVIGDTDLSACWATQTFSDGIIMSIGFTKDGDALWTISNVRTIPGKSYYVDVVASTGANGNMEAIGLNAGNGVFFSGLNKTAVRALANAREIYVDGLGRYDLKNSKAAMLKAWDCYEALNSY